MTEHKETKMDWEDLLLTRAQRFCPLTSFPEPPAPAELRTGPVSVSYDCTLKAFIPVV